MNEHEADLRRKRKGAVVCLKKLIFCNNFITIGPRQIHFASQRGLPRSYWMARNCSRTVKPEDGSDE